jgi:hypothetical protein
MISNIIVGCAVFAVIVVYGVVCIRHERRMALIREYLDKKEAERGDGPCTVSYDECMNYVNSKDLR